MYSSRVEYCTVYRFIYLYCIPPRSRVSLSLSLSLSLSTVYRVSRQETRGDSGDLGSCMNYYFAVPRQLTEKKKKKEKKKRLAMNDVYIVARERTEEPSRGGRERKRKRRNTCNPPTWTKTALKIHNYRVYDDDDVHTSRQDVQVVSAFSPYQQEPSNQGKVLTRSIQGVYAAALMMNNYLSQYAMLLH